MPWADCRLCVYFRPRDELDPAEARQAQAWVDQHRPGAVLLGLCAAYGRPVTYYTGMCKRYTPRPVNARSLTEFFPELARG